MPYPLPASGPDLRAPVLLLATIGFSFVLPACGDTTGPDNQAPVAAFSYAPAPAVAAEPVTFTAEATDPDGSVTAWSWDLGDGTTASGPVVTHTYRTTGEQRVTLTVTDDDGERSASTETVAVRTRLHFGAAAGHWYGTLASRQAEGQTRFAYLELEASAVTGQRAALLTTHLGGRRKCALSLIAVAEDGGVWTLEEVVTADDPADCVATSLELSHDADTDQLAYVDPLWAGTLEPAEALDFGPIRGTWGGVGDDGFDEFLTQATIPGGTVEQGEVAATWELWDIRLDPANDPPTCSGEWLAREAAHPDYALVEVSLETAEGVGCPPGVVTLTLDGGTLIYEYVGLDGRYPTTIDMTPR